MKKLLATLTLSFCLYAQAQTGTIQECDAPDRDTSTLLSIPWFGNNNYLEAFLDSIGYPNSKSVNRIVTPERVRYHVPILCR